MIPLENLIAAVWGNNLRKTITSFVALVAATAGAIAAVPPAWAVVEPYFYAHRGYVRDYDSEQLKPIVSRLVKIQLAQDTDRRQRLLDEVQKRELELQSDQTQQLPQYKELVQQRVDRVKKELNELDEQDKSLFEQQKDKK